MVMVCLSIRRINDSKQITKNNYYVSVSLSCRVCSDVWQRLPSRAPSGSLHVPGEGDEEGL